MPPAVRRTVESYLCLALRRARGRAGGASPGTAGFAPPEPDVAERAQRISDDLLADPRLRRARSSCSSRARSSSSSSRYRSRGRPREAEGAQIRGHTKLELAWTLVPGRDPAGVIAAFVFYKSAGHQDAPASSSGRARRDHDRGAPVLLALPLPERRDLDRRPARCPLDKPVRLTIVSPTTSTTAGGCRSSAARSTRSRADERDWFQAPKLGTYQGQCAELCGVQHAVMRAHGRGAAAADYAGLGRSTARVGQGAVELGKEEFDGVCAKCHGLAGQGDIGPPLAGNPLLADRHGLARRAPQRRAARCRPSAELDRGQIDATSRTCSSASTREASSGG